MNAQKFKRIIYLIALTAVVTVAAQVYRSIQNYQVNKERFINDVQQSLDIGVETYFADLAKENAVIFATSHLPDSTLKNKTLFFKNILPRADTVENVNRLVNQYLENNSPNDYTIRHDSIIPSMLGIDAIMSLNSSDISSITVRKNIAVQDNWSADSKNITLNLNDSLDRIKAFANKVVVSMVKKNLDTAKLASFVEDELTRKGLDMDYHLVQDTGPAKISLAKKKSGRPFFASDVVFFKESDDESDFPLETFAKSTYLSSGQKLSIRFENASMDILKRGGVDLIVSLLIVLTVIGSLIYLYRIITEQKALAEIKNDLISNISHEFKTPIATISTAAEGILNFNESNDPVKTAKYLDISKDQLKKLNGMVEKLLETASLDSDELNIVKEEVEVVEFTRTLFERFQLMKGDKQLEFQTSLTKQLFRIDPFHMENAVANLLDNAIKYGGDEVLLKLVYYNETVTWEVHDNGGSISKQEQQRIFEKFYRIPTGNVHDVKGFGIGLYYTKTLVEKHGGSIDLKVSPDTTIFSISIDGEA